MNIHDPNIATPKVTTGPIAGSRKVYVNPDSAPELRVPVREIALEASSGEPPVPVYDTTGPYTDPDATIDVEQGLPRRRTAGPPAERTQPPVWPLRPGAGSRRPAAASRSLVRLNSARSVPMRSANRSIASC